VAFTCLFEKGLQSSCVICWKLPAVDLSGFLEFLSFSAGLTKRWENPYMVFGFLNEAVRLMGKAIFAWSFAQHAAVFLRPQNQK
jgi:hypothetical protein